MYQVSQFAFHCHYIKQVCHRRIGSKNYMINTNHSYADVNKKTLQSYIVSIKESIWTPLKGSKFTRPQKNILIISSMKNNRSHLTLFTTRRYEYWTCGQKEKVLIRGRGSPLPEHGSHDPLSTGAARVRCVFVTWQNLILTKCFCVSVCKRFVSR